VRGQKAGPSRNRRGSEPTILGDRSSRNDEGTTGYSEVHAESGLDARLPGIETWPNQFKNYEITIVVPEYTAICPKTGLPDFGTIRITYLPDKRCVELKSLKMYIHGYRNLGIFYENAVNRILKDLVEACRPVRARVTGEFTARGGLHSTIEAQYP
jgi:7-cyano-7-deazaguanine reductase